MIVDEESLVACSEYTWEDVARHCVLRVVCAWRCSCPGLLKDTGYTPPRATTREASVFASLTPIVFHGPVESVIHKAASLIPCAPWYPCHVSGLFRCSVFRPSVHLLSLAQRDIIPTISMYAHAPPKLPFHGEVSHRAATTCLRFGRLYDETFFAPPSLYVEVYEM